MASKATPELIRALLLLENKRDQNPADEAWEHSIVTELSLVARGGYQAQLGLLKRLADRLVHMQPNIVEN